MVDRIVSVPDSLELPAAVKVPTSRLSTATATGKAVLDAANAAAARSALGITELSGTGMPNGVVTASPGTYYTDTAGTNGAWRWLKKSGTGNTGWDVVNGDTGWRQCRLAPEWADCFVDGVNQVWQGGSPINLLVRRVNERVIMIVPGLVRNTTTSSPGLTLLPSGWRPKIGSQFMGYNSALQMFRLWATSTGSCSLQGPATPSHFTYDIRFEVESSTAPWPATLPGTPA